MGRHHHRGYYQLAPGLGLVWPCDPWLYGAFAHCQAHGSFGGFRGETDQSPVHLARNFRRLAGFDDAEIADLVDIAAEAYAEAQAQSKVRADAAAAAAGN